MDNIRLQIFDASGGEKSSAYRIYEWLLGDKHITGGKVVASATERQTPRLTPADTLGNRAGQASSPANMDYGYRLRRGGGGGRYGRHSQADI